MREIYEILEPVEDIKRKVGVLKVSRDIPVGIATGYGLDGKGSTSGSARFSLLHSFYTDSGAHPAYLIGTGSSFAGGKAPGA
jgi:hypothetical protein